MLADVTGLLRIMDFVANNIVVAAELAADTVLRILRLLRELSSDRIWISIHLTAITVETAIAIIDTVMLPSKVHHNHDYNCSIIFLIHSHWLLR